MSAGAWKYVPAEPTDEMLLAPGALRLDGKLARENGLSRKALESAIDTIRWT